MSFRGNKQKMFVLKGVKLKLKIATTKKKLFEFLLVEKNSNYKSLVCVKISLFYTVVKNLY